MLSMKKLQLGMVALMCCIGGISARADFIDTFDRANSATVGNGWTQTGDASFNVSISSNELFWGPYATGNTRKTATLSHTFDASNDISVDMKMPSATGGAVEWLACTVTDSSGKNVMIQLRSQTIVDNQQVVRIYINNVTQIDINVTDYLSYHNYAFDISDTGVVTILVDDASVWQSAASTMGYAVSTQIAASRGWEYAKFSADNFAAISIPEPATMVLLVSGTSLLIVSKRRRK